jgi:hypothetical protein
MGNEIVPTVNYSSKRLFVQFKSNQLEIIHSQDLFVETSNFLVQPVTIWSDQEIRSGSWFLVRFLVSHFFNFLVPGKVPGFGILPLLGTWLATWLTWFRSPSRSQACQWCACGSCLSCPLGTGCLVHWAPSSSSRRHWAQGASRQ